MFQYKAPKRDLNFVLKDVLNAEEHYASLGREDVNNEFIDAIIDACAQLSEEVIAPTNRAGDEQGCQWNDGDVKTPDGFKEAYQHYVDGGWGSMVYPEEFGGQELPISTSFIAQELSSSANWSFSMYPGLSQGAIRCLNAHGSDELKQKYMPKMVSGEWTGTMCLTEPHCGSDLGTLRTKAVDNGDGSYNISGTKIFISAGEHDLTENIVHLVLARPEGAPMGTKGISLFLVPKFHSDDDGNVTDRNGVACGSIEHKMGIHGNATCVMNFDNAKGYLIGELNKGLNAMFVMMNAARIGTAMQGIAHSECALQSSYAYAQDRLQMRSLSGAKNPEGPADPIIVHPDVRRMLLQQKAFTEAGRLLIHWMAQLQDTVEANNEESENANGMLEVITPIAKAFMTEQGFESCNLGMQIFGGHGYISEYGVEQQVRDARISMIYEGTTGIQALDLLGRKVMATQGAAFKPLMKEMAALAEMGKKGVTAPLVKQLMAEAENLQKVTMGIGGKALMNPDEVGAASVDYIMSCGYLVFGYLWARMALVASQKLKAGEGPQEFYKGKVQTAKFYFARILPRVSAHVAAMSAGASTLMDIEEAAFIVE